MKCEVAISAKLRTLLRKSRRTELPILTWRLSLNGTVNLIRFE
jgi:hypothetical protein